MLFRSSRAHDDDLVRTENGHEIIVMGSLDDHEDWDDWEIEEEEDWEDAGRAPLPDAHKRK